MRYAICNETFGNWEHTRICAQVAELGYQGLEIAPFTLAPRITDVTAEQRRQLRQQTSEHGLTILGLHWLLAKTEGLQLTSAEPEVRARTGQYFCDLAQACQELGGNILVLGSPQQRRIPEGASREQAEDYALDTLSYCLKTLEQTGVLLCLEPLSPKEADFLQTAAETVNLIERLGHPQVKLHLDVKAMASEAIPIPELIEQHQSHLAHFHANDPNLRGPGFGAVDFRPIFAALKRIQYDGWISVEVFDYTPDPETIARDSIRYMQTCAD